MLYHLHQPSSRLLPKELLLWLPRRRSAILLLFSSVHLRSFSEHSTHVFHCACSRDFLAVCSRAILACRAASCRSRISSRSSSSMRYTEISLFRASARMRRTWIAMLCEILLLYLSFSLWRCIALAESSASDISRTTLSAFASVPRMRTRGTGGGCYRHSGCPASAFGATIAPNVARPLSSVGTILSALSALAIGVAAPARVQAETDYTRYTLPNAFPGTFDEIEKIVKTGTDPEKHIPPNLERAESG